MMVITRTPLRISFVGGGSDFESFYRYSPGAVVSATINKYIYITVNPKFDGKIKASYSKIEIVKKPQDLKHELIRESLLYTGVADGIEITSIGDIPSKGSGLGSSSAYTAGLLNGLYEYKGKRLAPEELASRTCLIEIDKCGRPIGKQDQYAACFGGFNFIKFNSDGRVFVNRLKIKDSVKTKLLEGSMLFYTKLIRKSGTILERENENLKSDGEKRKIVKKMVKMAYEMKSLLEGDSLLGFEDLLNQNWLLKKQLAAGITNQKIDRWYNLAMKKGALGGKVCFPPETPIKTKTGVKCIKEILDNEEIYGFKNEIQYVKSVLKRKYDGEMIEFKVTGLSDTIKSTPEHPFFTTIKSPIFERMLNEETGKKNAIVNLPVFKEAKEFRKGDSFLIPVDNEIIDVDKIAFERKVKQSKYSNCDIHEGIPEFINIDDNFLNTLGWYIAEGSANEKQIQFTLNKKEINDANTIAGSIKRIFSRNSKITVKNGSIAIVITSKALCYFFNDTCGKYAENKRIPEFIMKLPKEKQAIMLRALWRGDGCSRLFLDKRTRKSYRRCSFKTVSFRLSKQVQGLCLRLGYICSLSEEQNIPSFICKSGKLSNSQKMYIISIDGEDAIAFNNFLDLGELTKIRRSNKKSLSLRKDFVKIDGTVYARRSIREIKKTHYTGDVFNLMVDGSHTYIANDIAVHNCGAGGGGFLFLYAPKEKHEAICSVLPKLRYTEFSFEEEGSKIIYSG